MDAILSIDSYFSSPRSTKSSNSRFSFGRSRALVITNSSNIVFPISNESIVDLPVSPAIIPSDCFLFLLTTTAHPFSCSTLETAKPSARLKWKILPPFGKITSSHQPQGWSGGVVSSHFFSSGASCPIISDEAQSRHLPSPAAASASASAALAPGSSLNGSAASSPGVWWRAMGGAVATILGPGPDGTGGVEW